MRRYDLAETDVERLTEHVAERSEGNPFYSEEILHGLEDERVLRPEPGGWTLGRLDQQQVPPLLRQVLEIRLANLAPETRTALQVAAVIGQEVPLDLWQSVADLDDADLDVVTNAALKLRLLEEDQNATALQFRHALLREALYESLLISRRRALHRQVGRALGKTANPDPDTVAHHFQQAGDERALEWLLRAGLRARWSAAWLIAAERFTAAAAMLEGDAKRARTRGWLLFYIAVLRRFSKDPRIADYLDEADSTGDRRRRSGAGGLHSAYSWCLTLYGWRYPPWAR